MKSILRSIILNSLCLWVISIITGAVNFSEKIEILVVASVCLSFVNKLIKPLLNLIFLPLNLITLGTFRWVVNILVLFLVTLLVPGFQIQEFFFKGLNFVGFVIPQIKFGGFLSFFSVAFLLSIISDIINWIFR